LTYHFRGEGEEKDEEKDEERMERMERMKRMERTMASRGRSRWAGDDGRRRRK